MQPNQESSQTPSALLDQAANLLHELRTMDLNSVDDSEAGLSERISGVMALLFKVRAKLTETTTVDD